MGGKVLIYLGEASGMRCIICQAGEYAEGKYIKQKKDLPAQPERELISRCLSHAMGQSLRLIIRTLFCATLVNGMQLNLQTSMFTVQRAVQHLDQVQGDWADWAQDLLHIFILFVPNLL